MAGKRNDYFERLAALGAQAYSAAAAVEEAVGSCLPHNLRQKLQAVKRLETDGIRQKGEMDALLLREFLTPIDREDISLLGGRLTDVTSAAVDVLSGLTCSKLPPPPSDALRLAKQVGQCGRALRELTGRLEQYRKPVLVVPYMERVEALARQGRELERQAWQTLCNDNGPAVWAAACHRMSACCTACGKAGEQVRVILLKNG